MDADFTRARALGRETQVATHGRSWVDWTIVGAATAVLIAFAVVARAPHIEARGRWATVLALVRLGVAAASGAALWRTTRFS